MSFLPDSIENLINEFSRLPGIGPKTAQRLAFYLLRTEQGQSRDLGEALMKFKDNLLYCSKCWNLSSEDPCTICSNVYRDKSIICVVEEVLDAIALEKTHEYKGLYHVLHGRISPIEGVGPSNLKINQLVHRIKNSEENVKEIILATNPSIEGEATASYISDLLKEFDLKVSRIARGLPVGGDLDYADEVTIKNALQGRSKY